MIDVKMIPKLTQKSENDDNISDFNKRLKNSDRVFHLDSFLLILGNAKMVYFTI